MTLDRRHPEHRRRTYFFLYVLHHSLALAGALALERATEAIYRDI